MALQQLVACLVTLELVICQAGGSEAAATALSQRLLSSRHRGRTWRRDAYVYNGNNYINVNSINCVQCYNQCGGPTSPYSTPSVACPIACAGCPSNILFGAKNELGLQLAGRTQFRLTSGEHGPHQEGGCSGRVSW